MSNSRSVAPTKTDFQAEISKLFQEATSTGRSHLDVISGVLHRKVGGYPSNNHRMPVCCLVMRENLQSGDMVLDEPPKGAGATLKIRYEIPR